MVDPVVFSVVSQKLANMLAGQTTSDANLVKVSTLQEMFRKTENYIKEEEKKQKNSEEFRKSIEDASAIAYDLEDIVDTYILQKSPRWRFPWPHYTVYMMVIGLGFIYPVMYVFIILIELIILLLINIIFKRILEDLNLNHELGKIIKRMSGSKLLMSMIHTCVPVHAISIVSEGQCDFPESSVSTSKQHEDEVQQLLDGIPSHLRGCLLYFCMFPKEMDIPVRRLIQLWLAEGFVMKEQSEFPENFPEDLAVKYVQDLEKRGMVYVTRSKSNGRTKKCRLTAEMYDIFLPQVEKIGLFYLHKSRSSTHHQAPTAPRFAVRRVVEYSNIKDYPQSDFYVKHLRSYISFNFQKKDTQAAQIGEFVSRIVVKSGYSLLQVLDLEGVYKPALPDELGCLYNLRYLGLRWTFLDALPLSAGNLIHLQTLDVKHTYIRTLPMDLDQMESLRYFYLNDIPVTHSQLQVRNSKIQILSGLFVDKKIGMKNGLAYCLELKKLGLTCHSSATPELGQWIPKLTHLQSLKLRSKDDEAMGKPSSLHLKSLVSLENLTYIYLMGKLPKLEKDSFEFPPKLRDLTLSVSMLEEDPMATLGELPNLSVLRLLANSYSGNKMVCKQGCFGSLVNLKLWVLEDLEELVVEEGAMQKLKELEIRRCHKLKGIPEALLNLSTFKELKLTKMLEKFVGEAEGKSLKTDAWKLITS